MISERERMRPFAQPLLVVLFGAPQLFASDIHRTVSSYVSQAREIEMEEYSSNAAIADLPIIVMLSGSGGVHSQNMPFESQARLFAGGGYRVYLPHYLDVTHGSPRDPVKHYAIWAQAVRDALTFVQAQTHIAPSRTVLVGYSLGASVALAAATGEFQLAGIVVWSGSLPDAYVSAFDRPPPLLILHGARDTVIPVFNARQLAKLCELRHGVCRLSIYDEEGHAFSREGIAQADREVEEFLKTTLPIPRSLESASWRTHSCVPCSHSCEHIGRRIILMAFT
jgi:dienelactone hydrolase